MVGEEKWEAGKGGSEGKIILVDISRLLNRRLRDWKNDMTPKAEVGGRD